MVHMVYYPKRNSIRAFGQVNRTASSDSSLGAFRLHVAARKQHHHHLYLAAELVTVSLFPSPPSTQIVGPKRPFEGLQFPNSRSLGG